MLLQVLKWLPETDSGNRTAVKYTAIHLLHLGYCDAACALLDALPHPTFETSPSFGAFLFQEMVKTNVVSIVSIDSLCVSTQLQKLHIFVLKGAN
jgi:hypothetical protein